MPPGADPEGNVAGGRRLIGMPAGFKSASPSDSAQEFKPCCSTTAYAKEAI